MIKVEPCRGCGRTLLVHPVANLSVRLDSEPLDAQTAVQALLDGRNLWRVTQTSVTGARPEALSALRTAEPGERPFIAAEHRCTTRGTENAYKVPLAASPVGGREKVRTQPPKAPAAPSRPSSGPLTGSSTRDSVRTAPSPRSRPDVPCSLCGHPISLADTQTYALIELGATLVDAFHTGECPGR